MQDASEHPVSPSESKTSASTDEISTEIKTPSKVRVWDLGVRIFHWSLAFGFLSNFFLTEEGSDLHEYLGYTLVALIAWRILWGLIGPNPYARFANFVPSPKGLLTYLRAAQAGQPPRHLSHNPAGAVMMLTLMALIVALGVSGWMMTEIDALWGEDWIEEVHEFLANAVILLVPLHILGAVIESRRHRENLVLSMIHGDKRAQD